MNPIIELAAKKCDELIAHIHDNASRLAPMEPEEARARELSADVYLVELAETIRAIPQAEIDRAVVKDCLFTPDEMSALLRGKKLPFAFPAAPPGVKWAVFCAICGDRWVVPYHHPGKSVCDNCEKRGKTLLAAATGAEK